MIVQLNGKDIEVFGGARVRDAVMKHSKELYKAVLSGDNDIMDKDNNGLDMEGPLSEGQSLFTRKTT
ncbi:MAG: hypothetical protein GY765_18820 [bacterium]|nr:hypothetical protein [bacterium]